MSITSSSAERDMHPELFLYFHMLGIKHNIHCILKQEPYQWFGVIYATLNMYKIDLRSTINILNSHSVSEPWLLLSLWPAKLLSPLARILTSRKILRIQVTKWREWDALQYVPEDVTRGSRSCCITVSNGTQHKIVVQIGNIFGNGTMEFLIFSLCHWNYLTIYYQSYH